MKAEFLFSTFLFSTLKRCCEYHSDNNKSYLKILLSTFSSFEKQTESNPKNQNLWSENFKMIFQRDSEPSSWIISFIEGISFTIYAMKGPNKNLKKPYIFTCKASIWPSSTLNPSIFRFGYNKYGDKKVVFNRFKMLGVCYVF